MIEHILLVEDDPIHRELVAEAMADQGYSVTAAESGQKAAEALSAASTFALALVDIRLPDVDGLALLDLLLERQPECPVLLMTGQATVEAAVEAMRRGATDYLAKPFRMELLLLKITRLLRLRELEREVRQLRHPAAGAMVGRSPALRRFLAAAQNVAGTSATVLIQGESGTGKELAADFIHQQSPRSDGPLVKVNCGAIPESLLESELFGYEKGAFTGAERVRRGYLEQAHGGTLFLDEIGEISHAMQIRLLRVLQERKIRRLGGETEIPADFRLIAATHRDLEELRESGAIREDFFYRLHVIPLTLPPLRERRDDIPLLLAHFADRAAAAHGRTTIRFSPEALEALQRYSFPGNIRELENLVERLQILSPVEEITPSGLPPELRRAAEGGTEVIQCFRTDLPLKDAVRDFEARFIQRVLQEEGGNRTAAARRLGISRKNLWEKLAN